MIENFNFACGEIRYGPADIGSRVPLRVNIVVKDYDVFLNLKEKAALALPPETRYEIYKNNPRNLTQPIIMRWVRRKRMDSEKKWVNTKSLRKPIHSSSKEWCLLGRFTTPKKSPKPHLRLVK